MELLYRKKSTLKLLVSCFYLVKSAVFVKKGVAGSLDVSLPPQACCSVHTSCSADLLGVMGKCFHLCVCVYEVDAVIVRVQSLIVKSGGVSIYTLLRNNLGIA